MILPRRPSAAYRGEFFRLGSRIARCRKLTHLRGRYAGFSADETAEILAASVEHVQDWWPIAVRTARTVVVSRGFPSAEKLVKMSDKAFRRLADHTRGRDHERFE